MNPPSDPDALLRVAIREKRVITFHLHGLPRVAEPHVYGTLGGAHELLVYQVGGESRSGGLPDWRRAKLSEISDLRLLDERFVRPRLPAERHKHWDAVIAVAA